MVQFDQFTSAWDTYMQEYEAAAYLSLQKMRDKHDLELVELRTNMLNSYHSFTLSK